MAPTPEKQSNRYVNDLRRLTFVQGEVTQLRGKLLPFALAAIFLVIAGIYGNMSL